MFLPPPNGEWGRFSADVVAVALVEHVNALADDFFVHVQDLEIIDVPDSGKLLPVNGLVCNAPVVRVDLKPLAN